MSHRPNFKSVSDQEALAVREIPSVHTFAVGPLDDVGFEKLSMVPWVAKTRNLTVVAPTDAAPYSITDAGFAHLVRFREIGILAISDSQITDDGLKPLNLLPELTHCCLPGSKLTDKSAQQFAQLRNLMSLDLCRTAFGDEGVKGLAPAAALKHLYLKDTKLTDRGLDLLHNRKIGNLNIEGTKVTAEGVKRLKEAIPEIVITTDVKP